MLHSSFCSVEEIVVVVIVCNCGGGGDAFCNGGDSGVSVGFYKGGS